IPIAVGPAQFNGLYLKGSGPTLAVLVGIPAPEPPRYNALRCFRAGSADYPDLLQIGPDVRKGPHTRGRTSCPAHAACNDSPSDILCPASSCCAPLAPSGTSPDGA